MTEPAADRSADLRAALLDQLAYLVDEVEALRAVAGRVPESLLVARPLAQDLTIKETYGLLAALDETVYLPRLRRMISVDDPAFEVVDDHSLATAEAWNDRPFDAVLARVQDARRVLVAFVHALPPDAWTRTARFGDARRDVYGLLHAVTQHDVDLLRAVGLRLYEGGAKREGGRG